MPRKGSNEAAESAMQANGTINATEIPLVSIM
jgi:hypothetical protein